MNIDTLKALMNAKGGVARSNQFAVTMPAFDNTSSADMNILCQSVNLPGRQIMTQERLIGLKGRKMPTGFAQDDVNMSFLLLNDYGAKRNIEAWMDLPSTITNRFPTIGPIDFAQGEVDLDFHFRAENVKYQCVLRDAFPTTMSAVELNNELDGLLQVNVQISYRTWESI